MTSYAGWHAELYDLFYADKPYESEAAFVDACLREFSSTPPQRLLEIACGTGRHALALEKLGYNLLATDGSPDMLDVAHQRGTAANSQVEFRTADMRDLQLGGQPFDAAVCLFDSLGYAVTNDGVEQTLRGVGRHLREGGLFVFEFWHSAAMLAGYEPLRVRRFATPRGEILRISETTLQPAAQTCSVTYSIYDLQTDGAYRSLQETQTNRFFSLPEMAALLTHSRFEPLKFFAGFAFDEQITTDVWHVVAVARKQGPLR